MSEGSIMSHVIQASKSLRATKVGRATEALRTSWNQARLTDRELMSLRTELSRHSG
jgi:hypothetical protein